MTKTKTLIVSLVTALLVALPLASAEARVSQPRPEPNGVQFYKEFTTPSGLDCMAAKNQGERRGYLNCFGTKPGQKDVSRRLPALKNQSKPVGYYFVNGEGVVKFRGLTY